MWKGFWGHACKQDIDDAMHIYGDGKFFKFNSKFFKLSPKDPVKSQYSMKESEETKQSSSLLGWNLLKQIEATEDYISEEEETDECSDSYYYPFIYFVKHEVSSFLIDFTTEVKVSQIIYYYPSMKQWLAALHLGKWHFTPLVFKYKLSVLRRYCRHHGIQFCRKWKFPCWP